MFFEKIIRWRIVYLLTEKTAPSFLCKPKAVSRSADPNGPSLRRFAQPTHTPSVYMVHHLTPLLGRPTFLLLGFFWFWEDFRKFWFLLFSDLLVFRFLVVLYVNCCSNDKDSAESSPVGSSECYSWERTRGCSRKKIVLKKARKLNSKQATFGHGF